MITLSKRQTLALSAAALMIIFAAVGMAVFAANKKRQPNPPIDGNAQVKSVITAVSRHYVLPDTEVPALATVNDTTKLTTVFFKDAANGDKILIYKDKQIAIVYRPSIDRIIAVGPVKIDAAAPYGR